MINAERDLRETLNRVVRGGVIIVGLLVVRAVASSFLESTMTHGGLSVGLWTRTLISSVIIAVAIQMYAPVKALVAFYLTAFIKARKAQGSDRHLRQLTSLGDRVVFLVFGLVIYQWLTPIIFQLNFAFLHIWNLSSLLNLAVLVAVVVLLYRMWGDAQPLINGLTGKVTDSVSSPASGPVSVPCPSCGAENDRDAVFCVACGSKRSPAAPSAPAASSSSFCAQCAAANLPSAKFCCQCGSPQP